MSVILLLPWSGESKYVQRSLSMKEKTTLELRNSLNC